MWAHSRPLDTERSLTRATVVSRGRGRRTINEINMVPFIDVMLVLLIIFMVTAPLIAPSMINLPSVGKAAKQPDQVIQIVIGKDESLALKIRDKSASLTLTDLARTVAQEQAGVPNRSDEHTSELQSRQYL